MTERPEVASCSAVDPDGVPRAPETLLVQRYDRPAPRYTSYPPVPCWGPVGPHAHAEALDGLTREPAPLGLYVHLPFCGERCWYCGCNVVIAPDRTVADDTIDAIEEEARVVSARLAPRPVASLHLGGGTPNFLAGPQLRRLFAALRGAFEFTAQTRVDVELDPRTLEPETIEVLASLGARRVSVGVQDLDPAVGAAIGRVMDGERVSECIRAARRAGIQGVNLDLMYGLPRQTPESVRRTLRTLLRERPDRFAVYGYAHVPDMRPQQRRLEPHGLPGAAARAELFHVVKETLVDAGYLPVGLDHFVVPSDDMARAVATRTLHRTFQGYTTHAATDLLGLGPSAISRLTLASGDRAGGVAYMQNAPADKVYRRHLAGGRLATERGFVAAPSDVARGCLIEDIMCHMAARVPEGWSGFEGEREALRPFEEDGLVMIEADRLEVTETGRFFVRQVARTFDRHTRPLVDRPEAAA